MNIFSFAAHFGIKAINEVVKQNTDNQSISYVGISIFWELHITENLLKIHKNDFEMSAYCYRYGKWNLLCNHHKIKRKYLQLYLDEFIYKFNRRYFGEYLFGRLVLANITAYE